MQPVVSSDEMRNFDANTIKNGTSSIVLMKRASNFILQNIDASLSTAILVGSGNNGGDGISLAEDLYKINNKIVVVKVAEPRTDSAKYYLDKIKKLGVNIVSYSTDFPLEEYEQIIDCIFGVGLTRDIEGIYKDLINRVNSLNKIVVSADIPSGLNANNGTTKLSINATKTITFGAIKLGHLLSSGKDYTGKLLVSNIGIDCNGSKCKMYQKRDFKCYFEPIKQNLHKYNNGKVVIIGGSKNYVGAPLLSNIALSGLRVGAGLTTIAVPQVLADSIRSRVLESTLNVLSDNGENIIFNKDEIDEATNKAKAVAIGMGIGRSTEVIKILQHLLAMDIKLLIDADAITMLATNVDLLLNKKADVILTPHIAEFSRLSGVPIDDIKLNPVGYAVDFAKKYNVTLLLKGTSTIVTNGVDVAVSPYGNSSLAKGGSGDVLSGIILGLLAKNNTYISGVIGSYLLGRSAEILQQQLTCYSVIASDIPTVLPLVVKEIIES